MAFRNRSAPAWKLSGKQLILFGEFLDRRCELVFSNGAVTVYRLDTDDTLGEGG